MPLSCTDAVFGTDGARAQDAGDYADLADGASTYVAGLLLVANLGLVDARPWARRAMPDA
jgi:hypothetical protein